MTTARIQSAEDARLRQVSQTMRRWIVIQSLASNVGHVGSALSVVESLAVLFEDVMRYPGTDREDRDRFVLGKGHAALALYAALRLRQVIDEETFQTFVADGSMLGVHPEAFLPGVDVSTGSLGQSLSIGCGLALGLRERHPSSCVYVLISDAECNEGQIWEAAMFAAHHRLDNLTAVLDLNGLQAMGRTADVLRMDGIATRWEAFGWDVIEVDGHDVQAMRHALAPANGARAPRMVIARTVLGKGVSFMEDRYEWHYRNLTPELAALALQELGGAC